MRVPSRTCSSRTTMASTGTLAHDLGLVLLRLDTGAVVLGLLGGIIAERASNCAKDIEVQTSLFDVRDIAAEVIMDCRGSSETA